MAHLNQAYIFQAHQCSVCTFSTAIPCREAALQSSVHSLVDNSQDTNSAPNRRMALGHTKSSPSQKWLMVLEFYTAVSCHRAQFPVFCIKRATSMSVSSGRIVNLKNISSLLFWQLKIPPTKQSLSARQEK